MSTDSRQRLVERWLTKAERDLRAAEVLAAAADPVHEAVGFHAQQAAEKAIKALLIKHGKPAPRSHDLKALLGMLSVVGLDLASFESDLAALEPFAVDERYPGAEESFAPDWEHALGRVRTLVRIARNTPAR